MIYKKYILYFLNLLFVISIGVLVGFGMKSTLNWLNEPDMVILHDTSKHFSGVNEPIVIYTASWCPHCKALKKYLVDNDIKFRDFDVEYTSEDRKLMFRSLQQPGVPKIVLKNGFIVGFDREKLGNVLGI